MESKNRLISSMSIAILRSFEIRESMTADDIFSIGKEVLGLKDKDYIEGRVKSMSFEIVKGILKMKRYGWEPHDKFMALLRIIGYFN